MKLQDEATYRAEWGAAAGRYEPEVQAKRYDRRWRRPEVLPMAHGPGGIHGLPPEGSTYQCVHIARSTGKRCRAWAMRGQRRCRRHVGSRSLRQGHIETVADPFFRLSSLPYVYSKYLSKTLSDKMLEVSGAKDALDMTEELRLMKVAALDVVQTYDAIASLDGASEAKIAAGLCMREALESVIDAADKIAGIEAKRNDKITVGSLHVIVNQIVEQAYAAFGETDLDKVRAFAEACRAIRLPSDEVKGTSITPDQDVLEMDDTIPKG